MAVMARKILLLQFSLLFLLFTSCNGRIHKLPIELDERRQIDLTTFGFLKGGYLAVNITNLDYQPRKEGDEKDKSMFGFTLDKTVSTGISPYLEGKQETCILKDNTLKKDDSVSVIYFRLNMEKKRLEIERKGEDLQLLNISTLTEAQFVTQARSRRSTDSFSMFRDSHLFVRRKRQTENEVNQKPTDEEKPKEKGESEKPNNVKPDADPKDIKATTPATSGKLTTTDKSKSLDETKNQSAVDPVLDLKLVNDSIPVSINEKGQFSAHFLVLIRRDEEQGLYNLFFHNCHNYGKLADQRKTNFTLYLTENNNGNYLSAGEMPLPNLYFALCVLYFCIGCFWLYIIRSSTDGVFKIHYLMLSLVYIKALALLFHAINFHFIQKEGKHEEAFAILYYITHLMKGALLFITIVLIGAGWAFVKHILSDRDKKIFIIVIPLQILANVAQIIIEETEEGQSRYTMWKEIFILVDLLCCGAILFPVVWSIRHLQEASQTDGKAAINLQKLKIFRHFYIMIVCYIYFTRIIVYLLKITVPFQYGWLDELFKEIATLIFFFVTGYKFRPASNNPYLQVPTDSDDEIEMDEVITKSGAYENVVQVNQNKKTEGGVEKRESSHEYD